MNKDSKERKKPASWDGKETECFLAIIKELQVISLMDGKKFRTSEIFQKVEETFKNKGYNRTHTQLLEKFKAMKKRFKTTLEALSVSGAGTKDKIKCPFFEELNEIFGHRPIVNQSGIDSTIVPPNSDDETSDHSASNAEMSIITSKESESQIENIMEHTSNYSSLCTPLRHKRSSSSDIQHGSFLPSPITSCLSEDSRATSSTPLSDLQDFDDFDKSTVSSKKRKINKTPTYPKREGPQSGLKKIMENFTQQIIESQENLLIKTTEEQRKLDKEMFNQYNNICLQQTQMLLTGLQKLSSPFPINPTFQHFSGVPMTPMFTKTLLDQSHSIQSTLSSQNKNIHPYISHETQATSKLDETEVTISKFTTIPPSNSIRPKAIRVQNPSTLLHTSTTSQCKTKSCDDVDEEYENVEYLYSDEND